MKWEALESAVENIKALVDSYEDDFNKMMSDIKNNKNFKQVLNLKNSLCTVRIFPEIFLTSLHLLPVSLELTKSHVTRY